MPSIAGIGLANPPYRHPQAAILDYMLATPGPPSPAEARLMRTLYANTAIEHRHSVLPDFTDPANARLFIPQKPLPGLEDRLAVFQEEAPQLGRKAALAALEQAQTPAQAVTHLIAVTCTGLSAPGLEVDLMQALELPPNTQRLAINYMGCYAAFPALRMAHALCLADPDARVLLVCVELCTLHFHPEPTPDDRLANSLFADGAAAALVVPNAALPTNAPRLVLQGFQTALLPQGRDHMAWAPTATGFRMRLSSYVPKLVEGGLPPLVDALHGNLLHNQPIDRWALHPGGRRILEGAETAFGLTHTDLEASYAVLRDHGNMSSATILYVLSRLWAGLEPGQPTRILAAAVGPGLTLEAGLMLAS